MKGREYLDYYGDEEPQYAPKLPKKKKVKKVRRLYGDEDLHGQLLSKKLRKK